MASLVLGMLQMVEQLEKSGFSRVQSESIVKTVAEAQTEMLTKSDLEVALVPIRTDLTALRTEMNFMKHLQLAMFAVMLTGLAKILFQ